MRACDYAGVSTHAPTRGATSLSIYGALPSKKFQPTRPRGARPTYPRSTYDHHDVSTHAPTRGATHVCITIVVQIVCFNPRAHEGRDELQRAVLGAAVPVSTHAPTRGATFNPLDGKGVRNEFQPTRPRGARRLPRANQDHPPCFNPRAHEGRDGSHDAGREASEVSTHAPTRGATRKRKTLVLSATVSTHAPTRGATWVGCTEAGGEGVFQPTRPRGARRGTVQYIARCVRWFQPTRPRGARRSRTGPRARRARSFNPRAHEGRDRPPCWTAGQRGPVSTHAPTRGATGTPWRSCPTARLFQPTRPRGARHEDGRLQRVEQRQFQPTRPRGARRPRARRPRHHKRVSTHAPTRGATGCARHREPRARVSTHAPTRGATEYLLAGHAEAMFQPTRPRGARLPMV